MTYSGPNLVDPDDADRLTQAARRLEKAAERLEEAAERLERAERDPGNEPGTGDG